jgi:hypothetical protein
MTKEQYFEMCEAIGAEPNEAEIPIDFNDFPEDVHLAFSLYSKIPDRWEGMSGTYMGKDMSCAEFIMTTLGTEDKRTALEFIFMIDSVRQQFLLERQKRQSKEKK